MQFSNYQSTKILEIAHVADVAFEGAVAFVAGSDVEAVQEAVGFVVMLVAAVDGDNVSVALVALVASAPALVP